MKKLFSTFSILALLLPFCKVATANEYKFLTGTESGNTVTFSGVTADGTSTTLESFSGNSGSSLSVDIEDGIYDEYNGKVYFSTTETKGGSNSTYLL